LEFQIASRDHGNCDDCSCGWVGNRRSTRERLGEREYVDIRKKVRDAAKSADQEWRKLMRERELRSREIVVACYFPQKPPAPDISVFGWEVSDPARIQLHLKVGIEENPAFDSVESLVFQISHGGSPAPKGAGIRSNFILLGKQAGYGYGHDGKSKQRY